MTSPSRDTFDTMMKNGKTVGVGHGQEHHPANVAGPLSFATFSWMNPIMRSRVVPPLSPEEGVQSNVDKLEALLAKGGGDDLGQVLWTFCKRRVYLTSVIYLFSIVLGFIGPVFLMRKVLTFTASSSATREEGVVWILLLILCEYVRVLLFTLTWAMSYRTGLQIKAACMGIVYRKIFRLPYISEATASKILNVIGCDCGRIYEAVTMGQVAIGGPLVLLLSTSYILWELGPLSLIGMAVFPLAYPLQYLLAKGGGALMKKSIEAKDGRVSIFTQAMQHFKFIKMFGWEKHFEKVIKERRDKEMSSLRWSQLLGSWNMVLGPTLPHVGAIITLLIYLSSSSHSLTPAQGFTVLALFVGRIRPTIARTRSGFRAYFHAKIAIQRIKCFTILFVFSLVGFSVRSMGWLYELAINTKISRKRVEDVLSLPETKWTSEKIYTPISQASFGREGADVIIMEDVSLNKTFENEEENHSVSSGLNENGGRGNSSVDKLIDIDKSAAGANRSDIPSPAFQLRGINLRIKKGSRVGVCGAVGSGKSTFLLGLARAVPPLEGRLEVFGRVAYVPQTPWIFKGALRDNIIFGEEFDQVRYYNTIDACCLTQDFGVLPLGDLTETDDKGSNLSGGQRQRIALARCVYSFHRDIYILDNPFSSLDAPVTREIWNKVVKGLLASKTVVISTLERELLEDCSEVVFFNSDGVLSATATHEELSNRFGEQYTAILHNDASMNGSGGDVSLEKVDENANANKKEPLSSLKRKGEVRGKKSGRESIGWPVYNLYIMSAGGILALFAVLLGFSLSIGSTAFSSWWLKRWFNLPSFTPIVSMSSSNETIIPPETIGITSNNTDSSYIDEFNFNRNIYASMIAIIFLTALCRAVVFALTCMKASKKIHNRMTTHLFQCRLKAVDKMGFGSLVNLFSRDVGEVDSRLPSAMENFLQNVFIIFSIFVLVSIVFPVFLVPLAVLGVIFIWVRNIYKSAVRELKRREAEAKSPIFSCIGESISGLWTVRAFGKEEFLTRNFDNSVNHYHSVMYVLCGSMRWLAIRLDSLAVAVTGITCLLILIFKGGITAAAAGLALAYSAQLSGVFQFTVRLASETEAKFVSVERIHKFLTTTPKEEESLPEDRGSLSSDDSMLPLWPESGRVKFDDVTLSYNSDSGNNALNNVFFEVSAGGKIGIIGRTGSGKSSIGNALFRLVELKSGRITIDDVDISKIPLKTLRQALCVIPQEAAVFENTIRFNLDPASSHTTEELYFALSKVELLGLPLDSSSSSLSQGQKQLLTIARALLRNSKVVFVDEATSNVDAETSGIVDDLLATEFKDSTVFIVAHRMSSLKFCDWILILGENGTVRDFGLADVIMKKPEFQKIMNNSQ